MFYLRCIPFVLVLRYISTYYLLCVEELKTTRGLFHERRRNFSGPKANFKSKAVEYWRSSQHTNQSIFLC